MSRALNYFLLRSLRKATLSACGSTPRSEAEATHVDGVSNRGNVPSRGLRNRTICTVRSCSCRCHAQAVVEKRFSALQYTPLSTILGSCDNPDCSGRRHHLAFRVAFSQLGIPWAASFGLHFSIEAGKYSLMPSLQIEHVVRYTSPGFILLAEIQEGITPWLQGRQKFVEMFQKDRYMKDHVNPSGRSYIEVFTLHCTCRNLYRSFNRSCYGIQYRVINYNPY